MARIMITALSLFVFSGCATVSNADTGNDFISEISDEYTKMYWVGYVAAVSDALSADGIQISGTLQTACFSAGITVGQVFDVTEKYVNDNPEIRHLSTYLLTILALKQAFPCEEGTDSGQSGE